MITFGINPFQDWVESLIRGQVEAGKQTIIDQILAPFVQNPWLIAALVFFIVIVLYVIMDKIIGGMVKWRKPKKRR